jgi:chorismate synthase
MAGNSFGRIFRITTFGESHGKAVGVVVDGVPSLIELNENDIQIDLDRRRPGQSSITTSRAEEDKVEILSGIFEGKTTGTPIAMLVYNKDQRSRDYDGIKDLFRPGHADYTYFKKYGIRDYRGGGRASSRETIGRVCGGAIAKKILKQVKINITGYVKQIGNIKVENYDFSVIEKNPARCPDINKAKEMLEYILTIKEKGDSVGGIVEIVIKGIPIGIGEPVFDKLTAEISKAIMSIPAVKGIQFGAGFDCVNKLGSELHDELTEEGFATNNTGGTLGGLSSGQDIVFNFVVKPPSSILIPKRTIDIYGKETEIFTKGRHDPCVAPRVVPVAEAMAAIVVLDLLMIHKARKIL